MGTSQMEYTTVQLGDVENSSIAAIWIRIYHHLDWKDIVRGRRVCKTLYNELPLLITHLRAKAMTNTKQRIQQLDTLASAFSNLRVLELGRPTSMALEAAEGLLNWQPGSKMHFPALKQLQVHVDVAGCMRLHADALPVLETLLLASDVWGILCGEKYNMWLYLPVTHHTGFVWSH